MDFGVEVQNSTLESWLDSCMESVSDPQVSENQHMEKEVSSRIPEISERDVTSEIAKLITPDEQPILELPLEASDDENAHEDLLEDEIAVTASKSQTDTQNSESKSALGTLSESSSNMDSKNTEVNQTGRNLVPQRLSVNNVQGNVNGKDYEDESDNDEPEGDSGEEDQESGEEEEEEEEEGHESAEENDEVPQGNEDDESEEEENDNALVNDEDDRESDENYDVRIENEDEEDDEDEEEDHDGDDASSKISDSTAPNSPKTTRRRRNLNSIPVAKTIEDSFGDDNTNILEPTCELAVSDDFEQSYKSRFNLRKRISTQASNENDYGSDECEQEAEEEEEVPIKKLKFNFSKRSKHHYRRQRPYTNEAVKDAVKMVQTHKMSILEASRQYDIPRTSLHNFVRLYKRGRRMGVRTISPGLTKQEEDEMVSLVIKLSRCGKRYSHNELRYLIQYYLINNDRPVFKSGTLPTMGWIAGLVERQPDLTKAKSKKNTKVAVEDVEEWQKQTEDYLVNDWDLDIEDIFRHENGHRIFCFNAFKMTVNGPSENAENKPSPVKKEPGTEEEKDHEVSAILGMSADGGFVVPLIVLAEENRDLCPPYDPKQLRIIFNKTGRVDEEVALRVVRDFDEEIMHRGIPKPVVFFVNDKQDLAHFSVIEYCWENQIVIICLPPKTCKTMTPFEVSIWPKIRASYANLWKSSPKSFDSKVSVDQFPDLFLKAWESASIPKQAVRGFTKSGLIPLNVPAILGETSALDQAEESQQPQTQMVPMQEMEDSVPDELSSLEERSRGKLEGIQMCLEAIESFIPPDIFPVWNERGADFRGRCELAFKLWRSVSLLLKAGCAMASIQQMADGFFNPFGADFGSTAAFFQKTPISNSFSDSRPESPSVSSSSTVPEKPAPKKRKLNKSIYSRSEASLKNNSNGDGNNKPFVQFYQNAFTMQSNLEEEEDN